MRLIRTTSTDPELVYFADEQRIPQYAILSHVWEEEEVTFQHMQDPHSIKDMKGWSKIVRACEVARSEDWDYIWVDTCCIDKSSSAELSEAINSMYRYYHEAEVCYAYLADMRSDFFNLGFRMCKWFTRGWTLQELIAPKTVVFFAKGWEKIGTKASLSGILTEITGIASEVLLSTADSSEMSIAARMSWAAGRKTTRIEDRAYSLMGIFGVFMSPIYGEGEHAFIRLQEEILKVSDDQTIFAWKDKLSVGSYSGILATSPDVFEESGKFQRLDNPYDLDNQRPFSLTNMGLLVHLPLSHVDLTIQTEKRNQVAVLNCGWAGTSDRLAIWVEKLKGQYHYQRLWPNKLNTTMLAKQAKQPQELLFKPWNLPRSRHNRFLSDQISVFFSDNQGMSRPGQGIRPVRVTINSSNRDRPIAAKITDTADYSMGVYTLDDSEPCTFLFIHEPSHRPFVVVVVRYNRDIWLDLVLNFETDKPNLEDIQQSYKYGKESTDMPQKNFDRIYKFLTDNVVILVEARRQKQSISDDLPSHIVNIRAINQSHPIALPIRTYQYAFGVSFSSAINAGFSVLETYPNSCWETWANDTMNLVLYDGSSSGTICFQHEQGQIRFAVTFGIRQSGQLSLWSDVHFLKPEYKPETAEDICNSYSNPYYNSYQKRFRRTIRKQVQGLRNTSLIADDTLVPRAPWRDWKWTVSVHSDVLGKFHNQYKSEIRVFRFKD